MSNVSAIAKSLARSTETVEAAARSIVDFGKTVASIKNDVAALKQAIENNFNVGSIRAAADALEASASKMAAGLSQLGADLVAIDQSVPEAIEEPPVPDDPDLAAVTDPGEGGTDSED